MKALKTIFVFAFIIISSFLIFACTKQVPLESLNFKTSEIEIFLGNSSYLQPEYAPQDANNFEIVWSSSDSSIVSVNQRGKITAKAYGEATITVSQKNGNIKADCKVKVTDGQVFKIEVDNDYVKKDYYMGESFNSNGLVVKAFYESGKTKVLSLDEYSINCPNILTENTSVTVSYLNFTYSFDLIVKPDVATSISISKQPIKTAYYVGEIFDTSGMEVELVYASGKTLPLTEFDYDKSPFDYDSKEITITYDQFSVVQTISVSAKIIINDISKLQEAIQQASDGDSIMLKEGTYNTSNTFVIPANKNIIIYGESQNTVINGYNTPIFTITGQQSQANITLAQFTLNLAQGEHISLISNPNNIPVIIKDVLM